MASAKSEMELQAHFTALSRKNASAKGLECYLGGGAYEHFIPSIIDALSLRGEFATAYTPYQAEISQGTLQAIFEFQSMVANWFNMPLANASMYDGASAAAEACLMGLRVLKQKQNKIYISSGLHPDYRNVIETYVSDLPVEIETLSLSEEGRTQTNDAAGVFVVQNPNFYGVVEDLKQFSKIKNEHNFLVCVSTESLAFGLIAPPGDFGMDVIAAEGQSFGNPLSFGGPYVGLLACQTHYLRQMPGRLISRTVDETGKKGYVMTLTTREQHIRREKATSNICTNHSLCALRASMYMALLGKSGLKEVAQKNHFVSHYLKTELLNIPGVKLKFSGATFNEFALKLPTSAERFLEQCERENILAGIALKQFSGHQDNEVLITVTETKSIAQLDRFIKVAGQILK